MAKQLWWNSTKLLITLNVLTSFLLSLLNHLLAPLLAQPLSHNIFSVEMQTKKKKINQGRRHKKTKRSVSHHPHTPFPARGKLLRLWPRRTKTNCIPYICFQTQRTINSVGKDSAWLGMHLWSNTETTFKLGVDDSSLSWRMRSILRFSSEWKSERYVNGCTGMCLPRYLYWEAIFLPNNKDTVSGS